MGTVGEGARLLFGSVQISARMQFGEDVRMMRPMHELQKVTTGGHSALPYRTPRCLHRRRVKMHLHA